VGQALGLGLEALAVTDHDTLAGYDLAVPAAKAKGLELICGIELSTRMERNKSGKRPPSVHLLGYFLNEPPSEGFREWLNVMQAGRRKRNVDLIARLQSLGVDIKLEEPQALGRNLTGRPHFAKVLLAKGYVSTIQEAFDVYLADNAKAAVERDEPTLIDGIHGIVAGGGLASLAHPVRLDEGRDPAALRALMGTLVAEGLRGIEVYHSEHEAADSELYLEIAKELDLIVSGGSDFHGENKPTISLGTGKQGNLNLPYAVLEQMRERTAKAVAG
jgi:predicted metal-dependent phosphoesterase TrpH